MLQGTHDNNTDGTFSVDVRAGFENPDVRTHSKTVKGEPGCKNGYLLQIPFTAQYKRMSLALCFVLACTSLHVRQNSHSSVACGCGHSRVLHSWAGNISRARGMKALRASVGDID